MNKNKNIKFQDTAKTELEEQVLARLAPRALALSFKTI